MAVTIQPGGDPADLNAQEREANKARVWVTMPSTSSNVLEVICPDTLAVAATTDTVQEAGMVTSNMKTFGHVQLNPPPSP